MKDINRLLRAKWIWTKETLPTRNQYVYFRKEFTISDKLKQAILYITAERFYQLWVNGQWVGEGPALGHPKRKTYDIYDIEKLLVPGPNVIGVIVHFDGDVEADFGVRTRWYVETTRGGLWCQISGQTEGGDFQVLSDQTWSCCHAKAWDAGIWDTQDSLTSAQFGKSFNTFFGEAKVGYLNDLFFQEFYHVDRDPDNWNRIDFNDSAWFSAVVLGCAEGKTEEGQQLVWQNLAPRNIPFLKQTRHLPRHVQVGEVEEYIGASDIGLLMTLEPIHPLSRTDIYGEFYLPLPGQGVCTLRGSDRTEPEETFDGLRDPTLILDFGQLINAHCIIEVSGPDGAYLDIGYGPDLHEGRVCPYRSPRTSWADRVILAEKNYLWRSFQWRQFRYIQITIRGTDQPVKIRRIEAEEISYAWNGNTTFSCSDVELGKFWDAANRTLETTTTDIVMDNASRERRQYILPTLFNIAALHGMEDIISSHLQTMKEAQLPNGLFMDSCPGKSEPDSTVPEFGFYLVFFVWELFQRFGKIELFYDLWPAFCKHFGFWENLVNDRGLLDLDDVKRALGKNTPFLGWTDWALLDRRGEMLVFNGLYLLSLRSMADMAEAIGKFKDKIHFQSLARPIEEILPVEYWDEERELFVDTLVNGKKGEIFSEHAQGIMMYLGLARPSQADRLVRKWVQSPNMLNQMQIYIFPYFACKGLMQYGYGGFALEKIVRRYKKYLENDHETFGEVRGLRGSKFLDANWRTMFSRSVSQGDSMSWVTSFLLEDIAGLQIKRGTAVRIAPHLLVERIEINWCGHQLSWRENGKVFELTAQFPKEMAVEFVLPFPEEKVGSLLVNGEKIAWKPDIKMEKCKTINVTITKWHE